MPRIPPGRPVTHPGLADALHALHSTEPYTEEQRAADRSLIAAQKHRDHYPAPDLLENSMARPFSFPAVKALAVGESTDVYGGSAIIRRKVNDYAKRAGRAFDFVVSDAGFTRVTRKEDPREAEQAAA